MSEESTGEPQSGASLMREAYFQTYIFFRDLVDGTTMNEAMLPEIYAWREQDRAGIHRSNVRQAGAWHSGVDMHLRPPFAPLRDAVLEMSADIFRTLHYDPATEPRLDNMWANISPRHAFNRVHIHPNTLWSGVYYVQTPENCGRIYFTDPRMQALMLTPMFDPDTERRSESWSEVYYEPVAGRLLMFPSWLMHEVEPNMSDASGVDGDRISVSFNVFQVRTTP